MHEESWRLLYLPYTLMWNWIDEKVLVAQSCTRHILACFAQKWPVVKDRVVAILPCYRPHKFHREFEVTRESWNTWIKTDEFHEKCSFICKLLTRRTQLHSIYEIITRYFGATEWIRGSIRRWQANTSWDHLDYLLMTMLLARSLGTESKMQIRQLNVRRLKPISSSWWHLQCLALSQVGSACKSADSGNFKALHIDTIVAKSLSLTDDVPQDKVTLCVFIDPPDVRTIK